MVIMQTSRLGLSLSFDMDWQRSPILDVLVRIEKIGLRLDNLLELKGKI